MPEGHRAFAARSVLDGREHDGSLNAEGAALIATPPKGRLRTPYDNHTSKVKRRRAIYARVFTAANNPQAIGIMRLVSGRTLSELQAIVSPRGFGRD